ncbi:polyprenyl synthetase family protein [Anaerotalea alkaliphila]|uniref:Polyprenyl synthetase family protein n=1 Tax=Anaerotalea alkaliphila TaxID=2662126 RepID=A0A7X5HU26_9FIRM|nr:polyprenyl synthetase family protein [Anaerotalea alkaliphila]NDL66565.1 polyprenyl synthetase family protein [Anaerotalea alkaliphila]
MMGSYWAKYPDMEKKLALVQEEMVRQNRTSEPFFNESLEYVAAAGGKMLRPALLLLGSGFGTAVSDLLPLATAVEMLHLATLIHDDVIDEATLRRGKETIQSRYSKRYAVYMGDYLFSRTFTLLARNDTSPEVLQAFARGISMVCMGEIRQNHMRYNMDVQVLTYLKIVSGKTATLFAVSLAAGAQEAQAPQETVKTLGKIGYQMGMAFQLVDDLLDYVSDAETLGKEVRKDILQGYYTLPVLQALQGPGQGRLRALLEGGLEEEGDLEEFCSLVRNRGGIQATRELAARYTNKALALVETLPEAEEKGILRDLVRNLLDRTY